MNETLIQLFQIVLVIMAGAVIVALVGLALIMRSIRRIRVPRDADFFTTMRYVPFVLVFLLDLLDLGVDMLSAPIVWIVLDRMGLPNLRNKATIEALIPFTGPLPTFTIAWIAARLFNLGEPPGAHRPYPRPARRALPDDYARDEHPARRPRRPTRTIDIDTDER